jgi:hypothetical protein
MSMPDKEMQQLVNALRETPPAQNPERFASLAALTAYPESVSYGKVEA